MYGFQEKHRAPKVCKNGKQLVWLLGLENCNLCSNKVEAELKLSPTNVFREKFINKAAVIYCVTNWRKSNYPRSHRPVVVNFTTKAKSHLRICLLVQQERQERQACLFITFWCHYFYPFVLALPAVSNKGTKITKKIKVTHLWKFRCGLICLHTCCLFRHGIKEHSNKYSFTKRWTMLSNTSNKQQDHR